MSHPFSIRILTEADTALLENVADDVFDDAVVPDFAREFLADPRHHIAVAIVEGIVVGIATAVHYIHPDKPPELWVNEVGVAAPFQRQGIATELMNALFAHGATLGCREAWLATEEDNTAARQLYATIGGTESVMIYFTFPLGSHQHRTDT